LIAPIDHTISIGLARLSGPPACLRNAGISRSASPSNATQRSGDIPARRAQSSIAFRRPCNLGINRLLIEAVDPLDDLGADSWRDRRLGGHLDEARPSKHLRRRGIVICDATADRPGPLDRKERLERPRGQALPHRAGAIQ
jgi:hypothetical protein